MFKTIICLTSGFALKQIFEIEDDDFSGRVQIEQGRDYIDCSYWTQQSIAILKFYEQRNSKPVQNYFKYIKSFEHQFKNHYMRFKYELQSDFNSVKKASLILSKEIETEINKYLMLV